MHLSLAFSIFLLLLWTWVYKKHRILQFRNFGCNLESWSSLLLYWTLKLISSQKTVHFVVVFLKGSQLILFNFSRVRLLHDCLLETLSFRLLGSQIFFVLIALKRNRILTNLPAYFNPFWATKTLRNRESLRRPGRVLTDIFCCRSDSQYSLARFIREVDCSQ